MGTERLVEQQTKSPGEAPWSFQEIQNDVQNGRHLNKNISCSNAWNSTQQTTGVDLSKILGGQTKILGGQKVVKNDKFMGISQLLGARARTPPKPTLMQQVELLV